MSDLLPPTRSKRLDIPFRGQPGGRCLQACTGMVFDYFEPDLAPTDAELDDFTGYEPDKPTWDTLSMLNFLYNGYEVTYIDPFNPDEFRKRPQEYLHAYYDRRGGPKAAAYQTKAVDYDQEVARLDRLMHTDERLVYHPREAAASDIVRLIDRNWVVKLEVNGMVLAGQREAYAGHSVIATGYEMVDGRVKTVTVHNPDGRFGAKPDQLLTYPLLDRAWRPGAFALHAVRMLPPDERARRSDQVFADLGFNTSAA